MTDLRLTQKERLNRTLQFQPVDRPSTFLDRYFGSFGFYSMLRNWMGTEGLSYMLYDDPDLVHQCLEFLTFHITGDWPARPLQEVIGG